MSKPTWVRGSNPPALTDAMKAAGQKWQRLSRKGDGFLWDRVAAPSGASSAPRGV